MENIRARMLWIMVMTVIMFSGCNDKKKLEEAQKQLVDSKEQLSVAQANVKESQIQLKKIQEKIDTVQSELKETKDKLKQTNPDMESNNTTPISPERIQEIKEKITKQINDLETEVSSGRLTWKNAIIHMELTLKSINSKGEKRYIYELYKEHLNEKSNFSFWNVFDEHCTKIINE